MIPVVSIVGKSDSGKTTLIERLIPILRGRGYKVATVKHHSHPGLDIDHEGKDTWRHYQAGADVVVIAGPDKMATIRRLEHPLPMSDVLSGIHGVDIIITEGYKRGHAPKIEIVRAARSTEPICSPDELIALVTDTDLEMDGVPRFALDDVEGVADLIEGRFLRQGV